MKEGDKKTGGHERELTRVAHGAGVAFVGKLAGGALQYIYIITVARILGVKSFGLLVLGMALAEFTGVIGRLGLDSGVIRFVSLYNGLGDRERVKGTVVQSLKYSFIASSVLAVLIFLGAGPLSATLFHKPGLTGIIKAFSVSIPFFSTMVIALASTRGFKVMRFTVYCRNLFWPVSNLLLVAGLFFLGLKLYGVVAAYIITVFFASALSLYFLIKTFPEIRETTAVVQNRQLFRFSLPLLLVVFLNFVIMWTDTLMLGYFASSGEVGTYNAAMRTALQITIILASFNSIFAPMLSDLYNRKEIQKLEALYKIVTKWIYSISLPLFLLFLLLSKDIVLLFGREFSAGWLPLIILAFAQLVNAGVGSAGVILIMSGKQDIMMYNTVAVSLLNILLNALLIPLYGITGAATATAISIIILNIAMLLEVYILLKIHPYTGKYIKPTVIGAVSYAAIFLAMSILPFELNVIQELLLFVPSFLVIYVLLMYRWGVDEEDMVVLNVFKKKFQKTPAG